MRRIGLLLVVFSVLWMAACGSSGNGGGSSSITSVTVSCSPSTIIFGQTSQCSATVMGTGNFSSGVTWSASAGTISASGLFMPPSGGSVQLLVTITATSTQDTSKSGTATVTVNPEGPPLSNVQPILVDSGPAPQSFSTVNEAFTTVTVCLPGSSTCQTIDHVLVDTGSSGLRLLSSAGGGQLTLALPQAKDSSGNPLDECLAFLDGYIWGPVSTADIAVAGERASSVPVHVVIPSSALPAPPASCVSQNPPMGNGNEGDSLMKFGANGILGVGLFQQDCGPACTSQPAPDVYYDCPASGCNPTPVTLAQQVPNPVTKFATDNNGVLIQLPAVPNGGSANVNGSLIFGIGTQSNNALGSAAVYAVPNSGNNPGDIITTFSGNSYPLSFLDSGSNGIFFLDSATTGIPMCTVQTGWYCPTTSPDNLSATNQGEDANGNPVGSPGTVNFAIENADMLFNTSNTAFSTAGAPNPGAFDWGLGFYFGRNVFTAIEDLSTPGGTGPYVAY